MKRTKISFYFIFISIFSFFIVFLLIIQKSYVGIIKPLNQVKETNLTPINPKIDLDVISEIEKRSEAPIGANLEIINELNIINKPDEASTAAILSPATNP